MKIGIVGAGAMGGLFAAQIHEAGHDVILVEHGGELVNVIRKWGLFLDGFSGDRTVKVPITDDPREAGPQDLVLICVKAYDTESAVAGAGPLVGPETVVVSLQNGLGNLEVLAGAFGPERIIGGTTAHGATVLGLGRIRHAGKGDTVLGAYGEQAAVHLERVTAFLSAARFETRSTDDLDGLLWSKLIVNVGINALTALLRVPNGLLAENESARKVMRSAVLEALEVARAKGVRLLHEDPAAQAEQVARATATNRSSMLQDVLRGKRTEIDFINGAVVREAERLGLAVPVNRMLTDLVHARTDLAEHQVEADRRATSRRYRNGRRPRR